MDSSVTQLFTDKTVEEMTKLESKTRREIELKKEELRQMVGERYRDLIEAADTITEMKRCSGNVKESIKDLKQFCATSNKQKRSNLSKKSTNKKGSKDHKRYMEIAAEAKILMELPERIWSEVESANMLSASFLYLQSLQVLKNLHLSATTSYSPILLWFPMLGQQAQAVANLGSAILRQCHARLGDYLMDPSKTAEALCSIVLLEKKSTPQIFAKLMESRKALISEILDTSSANDRYNTVGAKSRICESMSVLVQTVAQVSNLFCENSGGLVTKLLETCSNQSSQQIIDKFMGKHEATKLWSKHLPGETTNNLVDFDQVDITIKPEDLQKSCSDWLKEVQEIIVKGTRELLSYIKSAKDLTSIRDSLLEILNIDDEKSAESQATQELSIDAESIKKPSKWDSACNAVFNRDIKLWEEILNGLFLEKINQLISDTFSNLLTNSKEILSQSDASLSQADVCSYVWQEHEDDITPTLAWNHWQTRKTQPLENQGGLSLKALTITSSVQKSCTAINNVVVALLKDLECYSPDVVKNPTEKRRPLFSFQTQETPEDEESKTIQKHLQKNCLQFLLDLIKLITGLKEALAESQSPLSQALHLSLVCRNFFEICPAFRQCCNQPTQQVMSRSQYGSLSSKPEESEDTQWKDIIREMSVQCRDIMCYWCENILNTSAQSYRKQLLNSVENGNLLKTITLWDVITVDEESESGSTVTSQIRVPASTTSFTQDLLYSLCSEVTKVGGFSVGRYSLRNLSQSCLKEVLSAFSELRKGLSSGDTSLHGQEASEGRLPSQTWAIQSLFDIRYLHTLLYQPPLDDLHDEKDSDDEDLEDDDLSSSYTYTELVDWLESFVDPFDLDVFSPHISRNIQRHIQRTSVMLGMLAAPDRAGMSSTQKFGIAKDSHNVMPMAADCGRFSYLPVSGRSNRSHHRLSSLSRQVPLASALRELTRSVDEDVDKNAQKKSSSLYSKLGALSSSWLSMSSSYTEG